MKLLWDGEQNQENPREMELDLLDSTKPEACTTTSELGVIKTTHFLIV